MKKIVLLSTLTTALLAAFGAHAGETTELKVKGVIRPASCVPSFAAGNSSVDYGVIASNALKTGQNYVLPVKPISMTVTCDGPTRIVFKTTDNRASSRIAGLISVGDNYNYGLGTANDKKIGGYTIAFAPNSTVDGAVMPHTLFKDPAKLNFGRGAQNISHDGVLFGVGDNVVASGSIWNINFNISGALNKPENLTLTGDVTLDGSATIEVVYL